MKENQILWNLFVLLISKLCGVELGQSTYTSFQCFIQIQHLWHYIVGKRGQLPYISQSPIIQMMIITHASYHNYQFQIRQTLSVLKHITQYEDES